MIQNDAKRWRRMEELFEAAIACEPHERGTFARQACGDDSELLAELQRMLEIEPVAEAIMENMTPVRQHRLRWVGGEDFQLPDRIGRYKVQRVIASGGMGTVYETTQENPHRLVAVKVMHGELNLPKAQRRFELESELLARLSHPGIAQVYEAGMHQDGGRALPYFAMEYISGASSITQFAEQHGLDVHQRLELFARACDAVEHGHQRGVIHRDLKPGNILVDRGGRPRIIDFGIARLTDADDALTTMRTDAGQLIGTLQYMSPEQCAGDPSTVDTRSDVYSLGIVLYELLCGKLPYDVTNLTVGDATWVVRNQAPARLSTMDVRLRGDVETVVQKALQKDKDHRYASASELGDDIRRYLAGEAIFARLPSVAYQLRVLARRNKILCGGVAAVLVVLVAAVFVSTLLYKRADRQRDAALAYSEFLTQVLSSPDPYRAHGPNVTVRRMLDIAAERIEVGKELADQPLVEATVRRAIGRTYDNLSLWEEAKKHLSVSLQIRRRVLGDEHPLVAESLHDLARSIRWSGESSSSAIENMLRDAQAMRLKLLGKEDPATLESMHCLAEWLRDIGHFDEAEELFHRVLELRQKQLGDEHLDVANTTADLGTLLWWREDYARSEHLFRQALAMQRNLLGNQHPYVAETLRNLGLLKHDTGHLNEAEEFLREAVAIEGKTLGDKHDFANSFKALATVLREKGKLEEAEALFRKAVEKSKALRGYESYYTAQIRSDLGGCLIKMERYEDAENELLEAQRILVADAGPGRDIRTAVEWLISLYEAWEKPDKAAEWLQRAESMLRQSLQKQLSDPYGEELYMAEIRGDLGECLTKMRRYKEAEQELLLEFSVLSAECGEGHPRLRQAAERFLALYEAWDKPSEAAHWREQLDGMSGNSD